MNQPPALILASASPRRQAFMRALGLTFTIHTADIDESPRPNEPPVDLVCRLSREKAEAVAKRHPQALIIAADTIVVFQNQILGKPANSAHATEILTRLSGKNHFVYSALTLHQLSTGRTEIKLNTTTVQMRHYTEAEIATYVATGDPLDKAGAYAIQHPDFSPVAKLDGCYAGVMGFPLEDLALGLAKFGIQLENVASVCSTHTGQPCCLSLT